MRHITKESVDAAISSVQTKLSQYAFDQTLLSKFTKSSEDQEYLSYLHGKGGAYCKFLPLLMQELDIQQVLELGNREGLSTLAIYGGLPTTGSFISVDLIKDLRYCPSQLQQDSRVRLLYGDVSDLGIYSGDYPFDTELLFSDTIHFDFQIRNEYRIYQHFLADTALIAIDDINVNDKRKFFDELPFPKWDLTQLCHVSGWGLVLYYRAKPATREERLLAAYQASADVWRNSYDEVVLRLDNSPQEKWKRHAKQMLRSHKTIHKLSLKLRGK